MTTCFLSSVFSKEPPASNSLQSPSTLFVNQDGSLTNHLITLLQLDDLYEENMSLHQAAEKTQKAWLLVHQGKGGIERCDLVDKESWAAIRERVVECVTQMGLFSERPPRLSYYDYGAWHGAFIDGVRRNLDQLIRAWKAGTRFKTLVALTGSRDLRKEKGEPDDIAKLVDPRQSPIPFKPGWSLPADAPYITEYDMMRLIFDQVELPEGMKDVQVLFVNAPKVEGLRPSTKDAFQTWLSHHNPQGRTVLACSYPLLWVHQQIAGETILAKSALQLDTIAPQLSPRERQLQNVRIVSLIFDTIAKCLYEIAIKSSVDSTHHPR